jgi:hypothetical protein
LEKQITKGHTFKGHTFPNSPLEENLELFLTAPISFCLNFKTSEQVTYAVIGLIYIFDDVKLSIESGIGTATSADVIISSGKCLHHVKVKNIYQ